MQNLIITSKSLHLLLLISSLFLLLLQNNPIQAQDFTFQSCASDSSNNYTSGTQFETNLKTLLLPSVISNGSVNGFFSSSSGDNPDTVFGLVQCRGDISMDNPDYVNLKDLLTVAGPFHTFLGYLQQTKVIDTFQKQANNTEEGITIFVPKDKAFSSLKKPSLSNLTQEQLKSLVLFHALPHYYSLADFKNLSQSSPVSTFAGGQYSLNFTDITGTVGLSSGWTSTNVSSSVHSTEPVAVYQVDRVLLPEAIFGTPPPAPAPSPDIAPVADSPTQAANADGSSPKASVPSSSHKIIVNYLVFVVSGGLILLL